MSDNTMKVITRTIVLDYLYYYCGTENGCLTTEQTQWILGNVNLPDKLPDDSINIVQARISGRCSTFRATVICVT